MNSNQIGSVISSSVDLIDSKLEEHQMCGSRRCPNCGHKLETRPDWFGLPAGVKFDPTDQELIEHLEAKVRSEDYKSHPLIDEFIPTIEGEDGICYTHPEKLPGVTRDGLNKHFFHRPSKAYTTGTRKRRKIQTDCDLQGGETRWHKTGKTRPVMVNGKQKGCKKILVLYTNFGKHRKPEKTNWVMHQYHLGELEEEKEGELVVSKIFYQTQPRQCNWTTERAAAVAAAGGEQSAEHRRDSGSGSSSSKEILAMRDDLSSVPGFSGYGAIDHIGQHTNNDNFSFVPFRKNFLEVDMVEATTAKEREVSDRTCDNPDDHDHHQAVAHSHVIATTAYHINRPTHPISGILSPVALQQAIVNLEEPYQRMLLNERFQQQQHQEQQHHKLLGRPTSGLEELIMGCTSAGLRGETTISNPQETEWLKYPYWVDPDNPDHHG